MSREATVDDRLYPVVEILAVQRTQRRYAATQRQKTVTADMRSKQLRPSGFVG